MLVCQQVDQLMRDGDDESAVSERAARGYLFI